MKKHTLILILFVIAGFTVTGLVGFLWYNNALKANSTFEKEEIFLIIEDGETTSQVITKLDEYNLLKSKLAARIYAYFNKPLVQAGEFTLNTYMTIPEIFNVLSNAEDQTVWVTIPEGLRIDEIAAIWEEKIEGFNAAKFETVARTFESKPSAEGYLFPDTYNVANDISEQETYELMMNTFSTKVGEIDYDTLILASIVEREAKTSEERPIIAGILKKRLDTYGWLLQADATLLYEYKDWTKEITQEMKDSDSPYNTYKNPGLPPTPICNPGLSSINAAKNPQDSDYWFYLHEEDGKIHYAATQEEHNQNIYKYLY